MTLLNIVNNNGPRGQTEANTCSHSVAQTALSTSVDRHIRADIGSPVATARAHVTDRDARTQILTAMGRMVETRSASADPVVARDALLDLAHRILLDRAWGCRR
jgi:type IV secretory pathway TrbF-like protein